MKYYASLLIMAFAMSTAQAGEAACGKAACRTPVRDVAAVTADVASRLVAIPVKVVNGLCDRAHNARAKVAARAKAAACKVRSTPVRSRVVRLKGCCR